MCLQYFTISTCFYLNSGHIKFKTLVGIEEEWKLFMEVMFECAENVCGMKGLGKTDINEGRKVKNETVQVREINENKNLYRL